MSRNFDDSERPLPRLAASWPGALATLLIAIGAALLLARLSFAPPARDLRGLALYLGVTGAVTISGGWLGLRLLDRALGLTIQTKSFLGAMIGYGVALLNVYVVARLMFLSANHDLPLLIALLVYGGVISLFFSLWVATMVASHIGRVDQGIRALAAGDYAARVAVEGGGEVAELAARVNDLAERLAGSEAQRNLLEEERRSLTAAISHDLRTPLASIRAMVEALDDEMVSDPAEARRYYAASRHEVEHLSRMIDDLFELAQIDAGALRLEKQPLALQEIAAEVVEAMQAQALRAGVSLTLAVEGEPPPVPLDGSRIEAALANLLRNALRHTPAGGRIEVSVTAEPEMVRVSVADSGEGIDPADLPHIWERFYRARRLRRAARGNRGDRGAGLGLAIVRGTVEAHGGAVEVSSIPGAGAAFTLRLPRR